MFFTLWPSQKKQAFTPEGEWLRKVYLIATICHILLSSFDLAFVGFWNMFLNLVQSVLIYSGYLTLRTREIWIYFFVLLGQVTYTLLDVLGVGDDPA